MNNVYRQYIEPYGVRFYVLVIVGVIALMSFSIIGMVLWNNKQDRKAENLYRNFHLTALIYNTEINRALFNFKDELLILRAEMLKDGLAEQEITQDLKMYFNQIVYTIDDNFSKLIKIHARFQDPRFNNTVKNLIDSEQKFRPMLIALKVISPMLVGKLLSQTKEFATRARQLQALHRVEMENLLAIEGQRKEQRDLHIILAIIILFIIGLPLIVKILRLIDNILHEQKKARDDVNLLLDSTAEGIFGVNTEGKCIFANNACIQMLGYSSVQEVLGRDMYQLVHYDTKNTDQNLQYTQRDFNSNIRDTGEYVKNDIFYKAVGGQFYVEYWSYPIRQDDQQVGSVVTFFDVTERRIVDNTLHVLASHSATLGFEEFLHICAKNLSQICDAKYILITSVVGPNQTHMKTLVSLRDGEFVDNFECSLAGTPCENVINKNKLIIPEKATERYPNDSQLKEMGVESYYGVPLVSSNDQVLGLIVVMDDERKEYNHHVLTVMDVLARRIAVEMERRIAEQQLEHYRGHLEDIVEERTEELTQANKELEAYSYSIAHDLRSPLRTITSFGQILAEDARDKLNHAEIDHLNRIIRAGKNMAQLIDDILEYSRLNRMDLEYREIDISQVCSNIIEQLKQEDTTRDVAVTIQPEMNANGDPRQITLVLQNLIDNAWKYTSKTEAAMITIGTELIDDEETFYIKDNGVGFDMAYTDKIFNVFQRLHRHDEFEGTGIGMAIVHRIITKHQGHVWALAKEGEGATFYFKLPKHMRSKESLGKNTAQTNIIEIGTMSDNRGGNR